HRINYDAYEAGFLQFKQVREGTIVETVTEQFPVIIARPFSRFLDGSEHEVQRLQFLRDTWEGLVNFVNAMAVGEARHETLRLAAPARCSHVFSERFHDRLCSSGNILSTASAAGVNLETRKIVDPATLTLVRELNQARNAFSHTGAPSEDQAGQYI